MTARGRRDGVARLSSVGPEAASSRQLRYEQPIELPQLRQSPEGSAADTHGTSEKQAQNAIDAASETPSESDDPPPTPARENKPRTIEDTSATYVEVALARSLNEASLANRWDVVLELAAQLEKRREERQRREREELLRERTEVLDAMRRAGR